MDIPELLLEATSLKKKLKQHRWIDRPWNIFYVGVVVFSLAYVLFFYRGAALYQIVLWYFISLFLLLCSTVYFQQSLLADKYGFKIENKNLSTILDRKPIFEIDKSLVKQRLEELVNTNYREESFNNLVNQQITEIKEILSEKPKKLPFDKYMALIFSFITSTIGILMYFIEISYLDKLFLLEVSAPSFVVFLILLFPIYYIYHCFHYLYYRKSGHYRYVLRILEEIQLEPILQTA